MASMTRKQYEAKKAATPSGWVYDARFAIIHGDHTMIRDLKIDDLHTIRARIEYCAETERRTNEYGHSWPVETGRQIPTVHVSKWTHNRESGMSTSSGLGVYEPIGDPQKNRNYKALCKFALDVSDNMIRSIADRNAAKLDEATIF